MKKVREDQLKLVHHLADFSKSSNVSSDVTVDEDFNIFPSEYEAEKLPVKSKLRITRTNTAMPAKVLTSKRTLKRHKSL